MEGVDDAEHGINENETEGEQINNFGDNKKQLGVVENMGNTGEIDLNDIGDTLQEISLDGGGKKQNNDLNITRLSDIDLNPDLNKSDITEIVNTNLEITRPVINNNSDYDITNDELNSEDLLNSIENEIGDLHTTMNQIRDNNSQQVILEHKDMPVEKKNDVKIIKLDVDKNTVNTIKK